MKRLRPIVLARSYRPHRPYIVLDGLGTWLRVLVAASILAWPIHSEPSIFPQCAYPNLVDTSEASYVFTVDLFPASRSASVDPKMSDDMYRLLHYYLNDNQSVIVTIHKSAKGDVPETLQGIHRVADPLCSLNTISKYIVFTNSLTEPVAVSAVNVIPATIANLAGQCAKMTEQSTDPVEEAFACVKRYL